MTRKPMVIAMFPVDVDDWAAKLGSEFTLVPTEGYTQTDCHECKQKAWIGPRQLETYQTYDGPVALLCYRCIMKSYAGSVMMSLDNPNAAEIRPLP